MARNTASGKYERLVDSPEQEIVNSSFSRKMENYGQFLQVEDDDQEESGLTDTENVDGTSSDIEDFETDLPPIHIQLGSEDGICSVKDVSKSTPTMLCIPEDGDNQLTDNEEIVDSANDSDQDEEPWKLPTGTSNSNPSLNPTLSIRTKRSILKKLHKAEAYYEQPLTSTSAVVTDEESLSSSESGDIIKEGAEVLDEVDVSSDSEATEGEVLSVSGSDSEYYPDLMAQSRNPHRPHNPNSEAGPSFNFDERGSVTGTGNVFVRITGQEYNLLPSDKSTSISAQNLLQLDLDVEEGITDIDDVSGDSEGEEEEQPVTAEITDYPLYGGEICFIEKKESKINTLKSPNTDEEDESDSDDNTNGADKYRRSSLLDGLQSVDTIINAGEFFNFNKAPRVIKKQPVHIKVTDDDVLEPMKKENNDNFSNTDIEDLSDISDIDVHRDMSQKGTDSEYHTGSEDEDLLSLSEFLTVGEVCKSGTHLFNSGPPQGNVKRRFRRRKHQVKN